MMTKAMVLSLRDDVAVVRAFTILTDGSVEPGIAVDDGGVRLGDRNLCEVRRFKSARIECGRLVEATLVGAGDLDVLVLLQDQAGRMGAWELREAHVEARWDAMVAASELPNSLDVILARESARSVWPDSLARRLHVVDRGITSAVGQERPMTKILGRLEDGASFEIRRRGNVKPRPLCTRVEARRGELIVTDPFVAAMERRRVR